MRIAWLAPWIALGVLGGCKREEKHYVERIEVSGATVADNGVLAMSPEEVQAEFQDALKAEPAFVSLGNGEPAPKDAFPLRLNLELAFTREAQKDGRPGTYAEVGATLTLRRRVNDVSVRYEVMGLGEVAAGSDAPGPLRQAMHQALRGALSQAVSSAHLQLAALEKPDKELLKDVSSKDGRVREFAIRTLSDRKNPGVAGALLEKLQGDDPDEIRRAMGALVELKERRAVPLLIELARGKDLGFLREILFALGEIGGEDAEAYLYTVAQGHDQPAIREAAQQALDELASRSHKSGHDPRSAGVEPGGHAE